MGGRAGAATTSNRPAAAATGKFRMAAADTPYTMMPLAVPFACSLRVTDPAASLAAIESGLAHFVASGRVHDATVRFDHVALTLDAHSRDDAVSTATAILADLGARRVQVFGVLQLTPPAGNDGIGGIPPR